MSRLRPLMALSRHTCTLWRTGQLRFRLETFGLYYPAPPYTAPWWKARPRNALLLLRQMPAYARWLVEMEDLSSRYGSSSSLAAGKEDKSTTPF